MNYVALCYYLRKTLKYAFIQNISLFSGDKTYEKELINQYVHCPMYRTLFVNSDFQKKAQNNCKHFYCKNKNS